MVDGRKLRAISMDLAAPQQTKMFQKNVIDKTFEQKWHGGQSSIAFMNFLKQPVYVSKLFVLLSLIALFFMFLFNIYLLQCLIEAKQLVNQMEFLLGNLKELLETPKTAANENKEFLKKHPDHGFLGNFLWGVFLFLKMLNFSPSLEHSQAADVFAQENLQRTFPAETPAENAATEMGAADAAADMPGVRSPRSAKGLAALVSADTPPADLICRFTRDPDMEDIR